jgi:acid stress-induced BolA-like protein IbaG/YrbA
MHLGTLDDDISGQIKRAISSAIPDAEVTVQGGRGHFTIDVVSPIFAGKTPLQSQRLVYSSIKHLMAGESAPVHAIDTLKTRTPT